MEEESGLVDQMSLLSSFLSSFCTANTFINPKGFLQDLNFKLTSQGSRARFFKIELSCSSKFELNYVVQ
jgi:hypothetical protein